MPDTVVVRIGTTVLGFSYLLLIHDNVSQDAFRLFLCAKSDEKTVAEYAQELMRYTCNQKEGLIPIWVEELKRVLPTEEFVVRKPPKKIRRRKMAEPVFTDFDHKLLASAGISLE